MAVLLDALMEITPGPLVILDPDGNITRCNQALERLAGTGKPLAGGPFVALIAAEDRPRAAELIKEARRRPVELRLGSAGFDAPRVLFSAARTDAGLLLAGVDVTEQRRLEARAVQARKGESLARLSRGMAHDFNNALAAVMSYAELILMDLPPDDPRRADVETIRGAAVQASELTRQILVFSRVQNYQPRALDLNALVLGLDKLVRRLIGEDIELVTLLGENLGLAEADPGRLESDIVSAVVAAQDAVKSGGTITIQTMVTGDKLNLTLTHSGGGAPFVLELPRSTAAEAPQAAPAARGTETIIVAEDNDMVRRGISAMLGSRGYRVLPAANGEDAIQLAKTHDGPVDLVLADVVMPRMTALELDTRIREARPGVRVMFMSGYTDDAVSRGVVKPAGFIQKPFTGEALAAKVREVLSV